MTSKIKKSDAGRLEEAAKQKIKKTDVVLDIGCGIKPQNIFTPKVHICVEPYREYLDKLVDVIAERPDRKYVILKGDWRKATEIFPKKSVDTVVLSDVIEHLEKEEGLELLRKTEEIARVQVIIFTTLGFLPQSHPDGKDAWGLSGGSWQEHRSGWEPQDFDDSWEILVSDEYHFANNLGEKFDKPYGALWAIKTTGEPLSVKKKVICRFYLKRSLEFLKKILRSIKRKII